MEQETAHENFGLGPQSIFGFGDVFGPLESTNIQREREGKKKTY